MEPVGFHAADPNAAGVAPLSNAQATTVRRHAHDRTTRQLRLITPGKTAARTETLPRRGLPMSVALG
jgi:hypothetical protein